MKVPEVFTTTEYAPESMLNGLQESLLTKLLLQAGPDHDCAALRGGAGPHCLPHSQNCHQHLRVLPGANSNFKNILFNII